MHAIDKETGSRQKATTDTGTQPANSPGQQVLQSARLDNTDNDGTPLNEKSAATDLTGEDLDVPGAEQDDAAEKIGAEDEENNQYSKPGN